MKPHLVTNFRNHLFRKEGRIHEIWTAPENPGCLITVPKGTSSPSV